MKLENSQQGLAVWRKTAGQKKRDIKELAPKTAIVQVREELTETKENWWKRVPTRRLNLLRFLSNMIDCMR